MRADLVLAYGKILTMNSSQPHAEAIAIEKDKIVKIGTDKEISQWIGKNTKVINLKGRTVVPGLIDTHVHVVEFGRFLAWIDLKDVKSIKEVQRKIRKRVQETPKGKSIIGHGWDQTCFVEKRFPTLADLDKVSPDNPIILYHQHGRTCVVNSKALEMAGITKETKNPTKGEIEKNPETGEPAGILRENATDLVWKIIPEPNEEEMMKASILACEKILEAGITSIHWIVASLTEIRIIQRLHAENKLPLRIYVIIPASFLDDIASLDWSTELRDDIARIGGVMIFADGSLAARTAALQEPYCDAPATKGKLLFTQKEMNALVTKICKTNLQLMIHAMGDEALDMALTAIEKTLIKSSTGNWRPRIENASVLNKNLINRLKEQKVTVSVQPCAISSEFSVWSAVEHLGSSRARWLYPVKTLIGEGIRVCGGSDCPMESISPFSGIQAAVLRQPFPGERITVEEALRLYTVNAAYASFQEGVKGSIVEGKLADLTVISSDPRTTSPSKIKDVEVSMTIVGGKVAYRKS
jgi:predicted amidohydrolase YtcJ